MTIRSIRRAAAACAILFITGAAAMWAQSYNATLRPCTTYEMHIELPDVCPSFDPRGLPLTAQFHFGGGTEPVYSEVRTFNQHDAVYTCTDGQAHTLAAITIGACTIPFTGKLNATYIVPVPGVPGLSYTVRTGYNYISPTHPDGCGPVLDICTTSGDGTCGAEEDGGGMLGMLQR